MLPEEPPLPEGPPPQPLPLGKGLGGTLAKAARPERIRIDLASIPEQPSRAPPALPGVPMPSLWLFLGSWPSVPSFWLFLGFLTIRKASCEYHGLETGQWQTSKAL